MTYPIKSPKKLIEVALPLDAINAAAAREKSIRHGHPGTLAIWWAPRPLATARAVLFAQLVNDPASLWELQNPGLKPSLQQRGGFTQRRKHLFELICDLVTWENTNKDELFRRARKELRESWRDVCALNKDHPQAAVLFDPEKMPGLHDPFAGGGAIPLEAQRLGLDSIASDLNPVAVLINKAKLQLPANFSGQSPVHPNAERRTLWKGAEGLAEDVRQYGAWIRDEAAKRIGSQYPQVRVTAEMAKARVDLSPFVGRELTVIAWLWARTVKSPNPAFSHVAVPLVSSFVVSKKVGNEAWIEPVITGDVYRFTVHSGTPPASAEIGTRAGGRGAQFRCVLSGTPIDADHIRNEARAGRLGQRLIAIVAEGDRGRVFLSPTEDAELAAQHVTPPWAPDVEFFAQALGFRIAGYGMTKWSDIFSPRQLSALSTFCDLISTLSKKVLSDARQAGFADDGVGLNESGALATAYSQAIAVYSALALSKAADLSSALCHWQSNPEHLKIAPTFSRPALPMCWDFAEGNPFSTSSGNYFRQWELVAEAIAKLPARDAATVTQESCQQSTTSLNRFVSTDPPYYDNIGYADLSDFFYVWMRRAIRPIFPSLFASISAPKADELVATPARHGSKELAERFFLDGMTEAMHRLALQAHPTAPVTIYYAFKQAETNAGSGTSSSGWETFLEAVIRAGFALTGTWPMRTERAGRMRDNASNALASSIVLVCRQRPSDVGTVSRREFLRELNVVLPEALDEMTKGSGDDRSPVAPVDLSQAIIGPGMAVFSKYAAVLEADGSPMSIKTALQLINRFLAEDDFDHDTQFCLHWFDQYGWGEGAYGEADVLARAKATSVSGLVEAGVAVGGGGKVRLLRPNDYPSDWDPRTDTRLPVWEALHQLIRALRSEGETGAGRILAAIKPMSESIRQLAYRLYTLCERRGWADDARAYNELVTSWTAVEFAANAVPEVVGQLKLFGGES